MLRISLPALVIAASTPAFADATTYWGTLGNTDIVLELSSAIEAADAGVVGRYHYAKKGIDIPLRATDAIDGTLVLFEENPCTEAICDPAFTEGTFPDELRGATWTLETDDGGHHITGTWEAEGKKPLPIELSLFGTRPLVELGQPLEPYMLSGLPSDVMEGKTDLGETNAPYDYLKTTAVDPTTEGEDIVWDGVSFRYLVDPRTKFPFPQIADLGGTDPVPANTRLLSRRAALNVSALDCESTAYLGLGWTPGAENWLGGYGGFSDEQIEVHYLSPTVMSWSEAGSLYCGGAYPENHLNYTNIDVRTGRDLDLTQIFTGSSTDEYGGWKPSQELVDLAMSRRTKWDAEFEESCGVDELIASNLEVTFKRGDIAVFTLQGLPHVIQACADTLFEAPLSELKNYLAPTAAEFFPSLRS